MVIVACVTLGEMERYWAKSGELADELNAIGERTRASKNDTLLLTLVSIWANGGFITNTYNTEEE